VADVDRQLLINESVSFNLHDVGTAGFDGKFITLNLGNAHNTPNTALPIGPIPFSITMPAVGSKWTYRNHTGYPLVFAITFATAAAGGEPTLVNFPTRVNHIGTYTTSGQWVNNWVPSAGLHFFSWSLEAQAESFFYVTEGTAGEEITFTSISDGLHLDVFNAGTPAVAGSAPAQTKAITAFPYTVLSADGDTTLVVSSIGAGAEYIYVDPTTLLNGVPYRILNNDTTYSILIEPSLGLLNNTAVALELFAGDWIEIVSSGISGKMRVVAGTRAAYLDTYVLNEPWLDAPSQDGWVLASLSGANGGGRYWTPVMTAPASNGIAYTMQDGLWTAAVTRTTTDSLTNKTLNDITNYIDADALHLKAYNASGGALANGATVRNTQYNVGSQAAEFVRATAVANQYPCHGVWEETLAGNNGSVRTCGYLFNTDTRPWSDGDDLYLATSTTNAGVVLNGMTNVEPTSVGAIKQLLGTVVKQGSAASDGIILIQIGTASIIPAASASGGGDGGFSLKYAFDAGTTNTPLTGELRYNNAAPASTTMMYVHETDASGVNADIYLDEFDVGDWIMVSNSDKSKYHVFIVSAVFTSGAGVDNLPVAYQFGTAAFSDADTIFLSRAIGEFKYKLGRILNLPSAQYLL
jgi:hypothetical protein